MSSKERRVAPRKVFSIPVRFRVMTENMVTAAVDAVTTAGMSREVGMRTRPAASMDTFEGETVNLSERGLYFKSPHRLGLGDSVELYFTLPSELTGRRPENVRCSARVVHVEREEDSQGFTGVGATVERFEPISQMRSWAN